MENQSTVNQPPAQGDYCQCDRCPCCGKLVARPTWNWYPYHWVMPANPVQISPIWYGDVNAAGSYNVFGTGKVDLAPGCAGGAPISVWSVFGEAPAR